MPMPKGYHIYKIDKEWLREMYEDRQMSTTDIASICNYSARQISRLLTEFGIKKRSRADGAKTERSRQKGDDIDARTGIAGNRITADN